jgi:hypothetical protein
MYQESWDIEVTKIDLLCTSRDKSFDIEDSSVPKVLEQGDGPSRMSDSPLLRGIGSFLESWAMNQSCGTTVDRNTVTPRDK